ncbi:MAG: universal stress protein, partial [Armatimonadetes bacterium]|nr:universal stress protein [Armatimonadota bacterium]
AEEYLTEVARRIATPGAQVEGLVDATSGGDVASAVARHGDRLGADLIVLSRHGRGSMRAVLFGRVAEHVLARGRAPVLLVHSAHPPGSAFSCRRILVPLDGSETAELALPSAAVLADAFTAELMLVRVVPSVSTLTGERGAVARLMPTAAAMVLEAEAAEAEVYLEGVASRLREEGIAASRLVMRGEPVRRLLAAGMALQIDLVVMATRGRPDLSAVRAGGVAPQVVARSLRPVLLVRVPMDAEAR